MLALTLVVGGGCQSWAPREQLSRHEFTRPEMGLSFRIVLYADSPERAKRAADAAFARIQQLNDILSDYDSDSELSRLSMSSGQGRVVPVSADLWRVLEASQKMSARSGGAFDITVGPVVNLWRKARREKKLPDPERLAAARALVGYQNLRLDPRGRTARLEVAGMRLDLGAIAKGYAVDEALKVLRTNGVTRALVAGGGDMAAGDPPPGQKGWRIELAPLDVANPSATEFVWLARGGLATSGDLFQRLEIDGKRYSHIVDPHTGLGLIDHSLVVVLARDGITADGLSTAISVLGPERGLALARSTGGVEVRIARQPDGALERFQTSGFARHLAK